MYKILVCTVFFVLLFPADTLFGQSEEMSDAPAMPGGSGELPPDGKSTGEKPSSKTVVKTKKIYERAKTLTASVINVSKGRKGVGEPISERKHWDEIGTSKPFSGLIAEAEKLQKESVAEPDQEEYMRFYTAGGKTFDDVNHVYEEKFYTRRDRLYKLVLAECIENKGRFLSGIEKIIGVICSEVCWTHPLKDDGAAIYQGKSKRINEDVAQTAWDLATAHYWLERKLPDNTRTLINETVKARVFNVFEAAVVTDRYENISWANDAGYENVTCHAAIVGAALALTDSAERRAQYIAAAELNVETFLQSFTRDGYFTDGALAWNEGYGSFIQLAEMLYQATNGRIDMFKRPNIAEAALYGPRMEIVPGVYEMFGDHWRGDNPALFPTAFMSRRSSMGLTAIENSAPYFGIGPGHLYMVGICCFPNTASEKRGLAIKQQLPPLQTLRSEFPLNGVMVLRTGKSDKKQIGVQLKGGNNDERSNHSDVGTYIVALGSGTPLCDIGARFNRQGLVIKDLYESNLVNSFGHPVPKVDDKLQKNGKGTVCPLLFREYTGDCDTLKFDLQYVYEWEDPKRIREFTRTFVYDRTGKNAGTAGTANLTVIDRFRVRTAMKYENCLITFGPYLILTEDAAAPVQELLVGEEDSCLHITVSGEVNEIDTDTKKYAKKNKPMIFESGALDEPMPRTAKIPFRLAFGFEEPVDDITMTVKIRPASVAERNKAKDNPGITMKTYTSPLDTEPVKETQPGEGGLFAGADGGMMPEGGLFGGKKQPAAAVPVPENLEKYAAAIDNFLNMPGVAMGLKMKTDAELKAMLQEFKKKVPAFKDVPNGLDDELVRLLRAKLDAL
ncbi:MAG: hypothetical protein LBN39_05630 [Planctomycetaceae bacterium]|jgi:hypothetical protein|nr:hypothetical protein [Planctomycetaceae bacterium]